MDLNTQIKICAFSIFYGMNLSFIFNLLYKYVIKMKVLLKIIVDLILVFIHVTLYFIVLFYINSGITSTYSFLLVFVGFLLGNRKTKKIRNY